MRLVRVALAVAVVGCHPETTRPAIVPVPEAASTWLMPQRIGYARAYAMFALGESGCGRKDPRMVQAAEWMLKKQIRTKGDWAVKRPDTRPGGWAFQYNNAHYPDLDDTAVVVMAMDREQRNGGSREYDGAIARGREWIEGMQSRDGGWAAFDVNNLEYYLNNIPFSDHGALLDPPTVDVSARCLSMLAQLGET